MSTLSVAPARAGTGTYTVSIAHTGEQIRAAQRLRYDVFAGEFGARLSGSVVDADEFDEVCDHLIVRYNPTGQVVGTYRLLPPGRSSQLYSDSEFDLTAFDELRSWLVEAGRSCVHPDFRGGEVINLMWSALGRYMLLAGHRYLAGCASVALADGGHAASSTWQLADRKHTGPPTLRARPLRPWRPESPETARPSYADLPPLLRGYLRLGAWVCGPPAHDPDFGVADFFVLLRMDQVNERYLRFFLSQDR